MSLIGGFAVPISSLGIILGYALAVVIHPAKIELSLSNSLIGGFLEPIEGLFIVFLNAFA